jgi:glycosyltransferase involved in cell wall biosynthesis
VTTSFRDARRLLVIAYAYPPMPSIGASRWDAMARHLRRSGYEVWVLTTSAFGPMRAVEDERHIHRAGDLTAAAWLRRLMRRGPLPAPSHFRRGTDAKAIAESRLPVVLRQILVPDLYIATWVPQALRLARKLVVDGRIDCVVTTSPYESAHLLGPPLRRLGPAWVADFRDGWSFEPHRPRFPTRAQRALDTWMERRVVLGADRVVSATGPIAEDFKRRLGVDAVHVANGFDPFRYESLPAVEMPAQTSDTVLLVHTGKLSGVNNRDPRGLFAAMRRLREQDPSLAGRLRLVLAGRLDRDDSRLVSESGLEEQIIVAGERSHAEALSLQRSAHGLLLIASAGGSEVTGKLFEYLSAGRPIIALAGASVSQIVTHTCTGITVAADDVDAITEQLRALVNGDLAAAYRPENLEQYIYPGPARLMSDVLDDAISVRAGDSRATT